MPIAGHHQAFVLLWLGRFTRVFFSFLFFLLWHKNVCLLPLPFLTFTLPVPKFEWVLHFRLHLPYTCHHCSIGASYNMQSDVSWGLSVTGNVFRPSTLPQRHQAFSRPRFSCECVLPFWVSHVCLCSTKQNCRARRLNAHWVYRVCCCRFSPKKCFLLIELILKTT